VQPQLDRRSQADGLLGSYRKALGLGALALSIAAVGTWSTTVAKHRNHGFDPRDESFYYIAAGSARSLKAMSTEFGVYLHVLLQLCGNSVARARVVGLACLVAAALFGVWPIARKVPTLLERSAVAVAVPGCALVYYSPWLPSPSYNLFNSCLAMLLVGVLLRLFDEQAKTPNKAGTRTVVLCVGGGTCAGFATLNKPTSGVIASLLFVSVAVFLHRRTAVRPVLGFVAGLIMAGAVHFFLIGFAVDEMLHRLSEGSRAIALSGNYSLGGMLGVTQSPSETVNAALVIAANVLLWLLIRRGVPRQQLQRFRPIMVAVVAIYAVLTRPETGWRVESGLWWIVVSLALMLWASVGEALARKHVVGPAIALFATIVTFGSGNGMITMASSVAGLFALAVLAQTIVTSPTGSYDGRETGLRSVLTLSLVVLALVTGSISPMRLTAAHPYGLVGTLENQTVPTRLGKLGPVLLDRETAAYVRGIQALYAQIPPSERGCLVVLSDSPFTNLVLGQDPPGYPWLLWLGKKPATMATYVLNLDPCTRKQFTLVEDINPAAKLQRTKFDSLRVVRVVGVVKYRNDRSHRMLLVQPTGNALKEANA
jgi:hypothetical protein